MATQQFSKSPKYNPEQSQETEKAAPRAARRPVLIHDALVPHTHSAQSMKSYAGELPAYVKLMDECAARAGLTIRRLLKHHSRDGCDPLMLVYSGTREQIERCELVTRPEAIHWPTTNKSSSFMPIRIDPMRHGPRGNVHKLDHPLYALAITVALPRAVTRPAKGVECFDFYGDGRWGYFAYCGSKEALVAARIADADMFPDDGSEMEIKQPDGRGYDMTLEESVSLANGTWAYLKYPGAVDRIEKAKQEEERAKLSDFRTPEAFRKAFAQTVFRLANTAMEAFGLETRTLHGYSYRLTPESAEQAKALLSDLYHDLLELEVAAARVDVRPEDERKQAAKRAAQAGVDADFKRFMRDVLPPGSQAK